MRRLRRLSQTLLSLFAILVVASCTQDRSSPLEPQQPAMQPGLIDGLVGGVVTTVTKVATGLLLQCSPLPYSSTTKVIGENGGTITVGPHTIEFPKGALDRNTRITAEVISDRVNSVRFSPEGLEFPRKSRPELTLSYANCIPLPLPKKVAYTSETLSILEVLKSVDSALRKEVSADLDHFSRYAVSY